MEWMYRYDDVVYAAPVDEFDMPTGPSRVDVAMRRYAVVKTTPKGVWLDTGRFVLLSGKRRFAWPTRDEALTSFRARKMRQLQLLNAQVRRVQQALQMAEGGFDA